MGFLAPWFLAGALAIGLPVYVHLLRRHKSIPLPFSSLMFFERGTQSSTKHRRLKFLLLFALRTLVVLLLALTFAAPFVRRPAAKANDRLLLIVVDHSLSMRSGTRLLEAKQQALSTLSSRRPGQKAQVMALGGQMEGLTQAIEDDETLRSAINSIQPGDGRSNFGDLGRGVRALEEATHIPIDLHLFSDMQRSSVPGNFAEMVLPESAKLLLHSVADRTEENWGIVSVDAPSQVADTKTARVRAVIAGYNTRAASKKVSLMIDGKAVSSKTVTLKENGNTTVEFTGLEVPYGLSQCSVTLDGGDALSADDLWRFAVRRSDPEHILMVRPALDTRTPLYVSAAIAAASQGAYLLQPMSADAVTESDPSKYAFVILSDVSTLPTAFENALRKYVQGGGNVLMSVGTNAGRQGKLSLLATATAQPHFYARGGDPIGIGDMDRTHPVLRETAGWSDARFSFAASVDANDARVLIKLTDGTPLLLDRQLGEGHVLVFASGFDNLTNDLPLSPAFVPFLDLTTRYLSGTERLSGARSVDEFVPLRSAAAGASQGASVDVIAPDGTRPLTLAEASTAQTLRLTSAGFYRVRFANGRDGLIGVNADTRESNLEILPPDVQQLWAGSATGNGNTASNPVQNSTVRVSLWWYAMVVLFLLALAESIVAGQYLGTQREEA
ncbi:BatA domain-containing protein [Terriglobus tenax]|uniref:BatA domain-containing protein n=1 Tax=Terriglobus tenax TaxID=1111115 RepID=UPI0021DF6AA5|nr:BatA domain-containing protein [Terriglobus tenax]